MPKIRVGVPEVLGRRRHNRSVVGVVLLCMLGMSLGVGWNIRRSRDARAEVAQVLDHGRYALDQARALSDISVSRAVTLLTERLLDVDTALDAIREESAKDVLQSLRDELVRTIDDVGRIHRVTPDVHVRLSLLLDGATGTVLAGAAERLLVADVKRQVLFSISSGHRGGSVISGAKVLGEARSLAGDDDRAFVLTNEAIIDVSASTPRDVDVDEDGAWSDPMKVLFYGENLYVVDRGMSEVYRYLAATEGFGERQRWFAPGVTPDLSQVVDVDVDGNIWMLEHNGTIRRFSRGVPHPFFTEVVETVVDPAFLSVPVGGSRVWVTDRGRAGIIAYDRQTGSYVGQWVADAVREALGVIVDEKVGKIFLLTHDDLLSIPIK